jgi:serine/threonine protein kinase
LKLKLNVNVEDTARGTSSATARTTAEEILRLPRTSKASDPHMQLLEEFIRLSDNEKEGLEIGRGTSGVVYKYNGVAIKFCTNSKYFVPEILCLDTLPSSRYLVTLFAFKCIHANACYLMFPYYPLSLETEINEKTTLLRTNRKKWEAQLFKGVRVLHKHGIYHRDIKPANIMITQTGSIVFVDFGIADLDATSFGFKGTVTHISNEDTRCNASQRDEAHIKRCKVWHDMYATAITVYEMYAEQKYKGHLHDRFLPDVCRRMSDFSQSILKEDVDRGQRLSKRLIRRIRRSSSSLKKKPPRRKPTSRVVTK